MCIKQYMEGFTVVFNHCFELMVSYFNFLTRRYTILKPIPGCLRIDGQYGVQWYGYLILYCTHEEFSENLKQNENIFNVMYKQLV